VHSSNYYTAIATDMISLAWEDAWDVAILISSDKDFISVFGIVSTCPNNRFAL